MSINVNIPLSSNTVVAIQSARNDTEAVDAIPAASTFRAIVDAVKALPVRTESKPSKKRRAPSESDHRTELPERTKQAPLDSVPDSAASAATGKPASPQDCYGIQNPKYRGFQMFVNLFKLSTGGTITIETPWGGDTTIRKLRELIGKRIKFPGEQIRLMFGGKHLGGFPFPNGDISEEAMKRERMTLAESGIRKEDTVYWM